MVYFTGDTHGDMDIYKLSSSNWNKGKELTKKDYLIVLGDFGLLWNKEEDNHEKNLKGWLESKPWTTLFLDGNHENFNRINSLEQIEMFGGKVGKYGDSIFHLKRGEIYNIDGETFFTFGGGYSIDKRLRKENVSWWAEEMPSDEEYKKGLDNLKKHNNKVDYILTHSCSEKSFNKIDIGSGGRFTPKIKGEEKLREYFDKVENLVEFKHWYFGHFHFDFDLGDNQTTLYNSIIKKT